MKLHLTGWLLLIMLCSMVGDPVSAQTTPLRGPKNATDQFSGAVYGPIDSQDTLWRIANRYRQNRNVTIYQVMVAIYELNPDAFEQQNLNLMVDGAVLRLPSDRYIARIDSVKARQKAEADEAAWARMEPKPGDSLNNLKPPVPLVNQEDLSQTRTELERQLVQIDQSQTRQFEQLRNQFAESIDSVQTLLDDNQKLYDRIEKINQELALLRGRVNEEVEVKVEQQSALLREVKDILLSDRAAQQAEKDSSIAKMLTSPIALIVGTALVSLSAIIGLAVWLMKRKSAPEEAGIQLPEPEVQVEEEAIADLSTAIEIDVDDDDLSDDDLFNDDDLLDDVLSTELESSLGDDDAFAELNDDMLVPDDDTDSFEPGEEELDQDELDSLFDDEFANTDSDEAIDLSDDDDLLNDFDSELEDTDIQSDGLTSDEELAALLEDPASVGDMADSEDVADDDIDALLADNEAEPDLDADVDPDDIDALLDSGQAIEPEQTDTADFDSTDNPLPENELAEDLSSDIDDSASEAVLSKAPIDDVDDKPEISIDDLLDEPEEDEGVTLPVDDGPISDDMLTKLDEEIEQQSQSLDRLTDSIINEIDQIEMMGDLAADLDDDGEQDADEITPQPDRSENESKLQNIDDLTDELDEIDVNIDDIENAEVLADPLSDELLAELEAELPEEYLADDVVEDASLSDSVDDTSQFEDEVNDELTDELLQELGEFEPEPESDFDEIDDFEESIDDSELSDPLTDELLAELGEAATNEDDEQASADALPTGEVDEIDDPLTDELLAELSSADDDVGVAESVSEPEESPIDTLSDELVNELTAQAEQDEPDTEFELSDNNDDATDTLVSELEALDRAKAEDAQTKPSDSTENDAADADTEDALDQALAEFDQQMMEDIPAFAEQSEQIAPTQDNAEPIDDDALDQALDDFNSDPDSFELAQEQDGVLPVDTDVEPVADELEDLPGLDEWLGGDSGEEAAILDELDNSEFDELLDSIENDEPADRALEAFKLDNPDLDLQALFNEDSTGENDNNDTSDSPLTDDAGVENQQQEAFVDVETLMAETDMHDTDDNDPELDLDVSLSEFSGVHDDDDVFDIDKDSGQNANLDLARVYLEMDDAEAAKELLSEVLDNGSESQKSEAQALLNSLAS